MQSQGNEQRSCEGEGEGAKTSLRKLKGANPT